MGMYITVLVVLYLNNFSTQNLTGLMHLLWILVPSFCCPCGDGSLHISSCTILASNICVNCYRSQCVSVQCVNASSWGSDGKPSSPPWSPAAGVGWAGGSTNSAAARAWSVVESVPTPQVPGGHWRPKVGSLLSEFLESQFQPYQRSTALVFFVSTSDLMCWLAEQFTGVCSSLEVSRYLLGQCRVEVFHAFPGC